MDIYTRRSIAAAIATLACLLAGLPAQAQTTQTVTINTGALSGLGTFYLDFTLTDGAQTGNGNSRAVISNFALGGGQMGTVLAPTTGDAAGSLDGSMTLVDDGHSVTGSDLSPNGTADFAQSFTVTSLSSTLVFNLTLSSTSVEALSPDAFFFTLSNASAGPLATTGPNGFEFVSAQFMTTRPVPLGFASTDPTYAPTVRAVISPASAAEPTPFAALSLGVLSLGILTMRARKRIAAAL